MRFRLVLHDTQSDNKYDATSRHEYLGDRDATWHLWYTLAKVLGKKHVEVFNLDGTKLDPEKGLHLMTDYNV
jgi:hypothetical protein